MRRNVGSMPCRLRLGVYWNEHNIERPCVMLEVPAGAPPTVFDLRTMERILDPPSAIPIAREEPTD